MYSLISSFYYSFYCIFWANSLLWDTFLRRQNISKRFFFRSPTNLSFRCLVNSSGVFIGKSVKLRESWLFVQGKELSIGFKTEVQWLALKGVLDTDEDYNSNDVGSSPTYSTFVCFVPSFLTSSSLFFLISLVSNLVTFVAREER